MIHVNLEPCRKIEVHTSACRVSVSVAGQFIRTDSSERYTGQYNVTPDFDTQTLETENKYMTDDVTVFPIPVHRTTNPYGTTVYIGGLLNG